MMAVPLGGLLSFAVTGPMAQSHGWRVALAVAALPAAALVPAVLWLREPERIGARPELAPLRALNVPAFWWIAGSGAIVNFVLYTFSTFLPAFLTRFHGFSVAQAGLWTGIGSGAAGILGALAAGVLGDRVTGNRGGARMRLSAGAALLAAPLAFAGIRLPPNNALAAVVLVMAAYGLLQMYYGLVYAAIQDIVPPSLRGTAMAAYFTATYLCGASFGPLLTGGLSDRLARAAAGAGPMTEAAKAVGLHQAMYGIPALSVALAAVLWAGGRKADR